MQRLLIFRTMNSTLCILSPKSMSGRESDSDPEDLEHAVKLRQVKAVLEEVLEERTFWNGAGRKFLRDIQEGSTEAAEVG
ncbi:hypothetical protein IGI04_022921, partial [Brassica rapa subsp. trilocularis]